MFIVTHAIVGAFIGKHLPTHPYVAAILSFLVHFVNDIIPHGDTDLYKGYLAGFKARKMVVYVGGDILAAIIFIAVLFPLTPPAERLAVAAGIAGGVLPDILVGVYEVSKHRWFKPFHRMHFFIHNLISHRTGDLPLWAGFILEVVIMGVFGWGLFF